MQPGRSDHLPRHPACAFEICWSTFPLLGFKQPGVLPEVYFLGDAGTQLNEFILGIMVIGVEKKVEQMWIVEKKTQREDDIGRKCMTKGVRKTKARIVPTAPVLDLQNCPWRACCLY